MPSIDTQKTYIILFISNKIDSDLILMFFHCIVTQVHSFLCEIMYYEVVYIHICFT